MEPTSPVSSPETHPLYSYRVGSLVRLDGDTAVILARRHGRVEVDLGDRVTWLPGSRPAALLEEWTPENSEAQFETLNSLGRVDHSPSPMVFTGALRLSRRGRSQIEVERLLDRDEM